MPVISTLRRLKQNDLCKFKVNMGYKAGSRPVKTI